MYFTMDLMYMNYLKLKKNKLEQVTLRDTKLLLLNLILESDELF